MRTNIVLDENLIERAKELTAIKTKREVVQEALRTLILLCEQAEVGGSANQGKGLQAHLDQALAAIRFDGDLEVFHRQIEHLSYLTPHSVALVQEQHITLLEHDQDGSQVSLLLD